MCNVGQTQGSWPQWNMVSNAFPYQKLHWFVANKIKRKEYIRKERKKYVNVGEDKRAN